MMKIKIFSLFSASMAVSLLVCGFSSPVQAGEFSPEFSFGNTDSAKSIKEIQQLARANFKNIPAKNVSINNYKIFDHVKDASRQNHQMMKAVKKKVCKTRKLGGKKAANFERPYIL